MYYKQRIKVTSNSQDLLTVYQCRKVMLGLLNWQQGQIIARKGAGYIGNTLTWAEQGKVMAVIIHFILQLEGVTMDLRGDEF